MLIHNDPQVFVEAQSLQTVGASPLATSLLSLHKYFPQLVFDTTSSALDGVVSDLHRVLAMIKFHRGTLAPIHILPDDILTRIFRFYHSHSGLAGDLAWTKIMLVCRRWHSLIMSDGYLWSFIDPSKLDQWTLDWHSHIKRAGNWPLSISHKGHSDVDVYPYELLAATTVPNRVHSLQLMHCSESLILDILRVLSAAGIPELATLEIVSASRADNDSEPFVLPPNILSLPKLSCLILTDMIIDTKLVPPQITRLDLCMRTSSVCYDLRQFLDALSTLPNLQILNLERSVRDVLHRRPYPMVHLPLLRILSISGFRDVIVHFLTSLVIPHTTSIFVSTRPIIKNATSRDLIAPLRNFFRHTQGTRIRAVKIQNMMGNASSDFDTTIIGFAHKDVKSADFMAAFDERKCMSLEFFSESAKRQKRLARKVFTSLMYQAELLDIMSMSRGSLSASWCKMALLSLPALTEVHLTADTSTCIVFCQCLQKLIVVGGSSKLCPKAAIHI
ncbi:hypothetical protein CPB85DRAFT_1558230 [Mucidula mucida]|nr:hypothetical protein CPB85DRAFT_1558230 [Mucidula mucida]